MALPPITSQQLRKLKPYTPASLPSVCRTCASKSLATPIEWSVSTWREGERGGRTSYYCDPHLPSKWREEAAALLAKLAERKAENA